MRYYLILLFAFIISACEENQGEEVEYVVTYEDENDDLNNFEAFSLSPYGINAMIYLPDASSEIGVATDPKVDYRVDGFKWDLYLGQNFHMRIDDWGVEDGIKMHKEQLKLNKSVYEVEFLEEKPDFIYYKRTLRSEGVNGTDSNIGIEHVSYHIYGLHTIDGVNYVFRTNDDGHAKTTTDYMAITIKNVAELKPES